MTIVITSYRQLNCAVIQNWNLQQLTVRIINDMTIYRVYHYNLSWVAIVFIKSNLHDLMVTVIPSSKIVRIAPALVILYTVCSGRSVIIKCHWRQVIGHGLEVL